jgi:hypothetical protein
MGKQADHKQDEKGRARASPRSRFFEALPAVGSAFD